MKKIIYQDKDFKTAGKVKIFNYRKSQVWFTNQFKLILPKTLNHKLRNILADELKIKKQLFGVKEEKAPKDMGKSQV
jgi:hypothetical protein